MILPDGNLSTVSIDEVNVIDISKYERLSNELHKRGSCIIEMGVKDNETALSNESLNILKGHSDLSDYFLTHFCL